MVARRLAVGLNGSAIVRSSRKARAATASPCSSPMRTEPVRGACESRAARRVRSGASASVARRRTWLLAAYMDASERERERERKKSAREKKRQTRKRQGQET